MRLWRCRLKATPSTPAMVPVALYVPNLIGYTRIALGLAAFSYARDAAQWQWFFGLYFLSYALDAVDGVAARALQQTSRLGALLDMVTDRAATAGLLALLAALYPAHAFTFTTLLMLDIVSHWAQMCASLSVGARSHKVRRRLCARATPDCPRAGVAEGSLCGGSVWQMAQSQALPCIAHPHSPLAVRVGPGERPSVLLL